MTERNKQANRLAYVPRNKVGTRGHGRRNATVGMPYPELVATGEWEVIDLATVKNGVPGFSKSEKKLRVPLGDFPDDKEVRGQELTKLKISPEMVPADISPVIMNAVEDLRTHSYMRRKVGISKAYDTLSTNDRAHVRAAIKNMAERVSSMQQDLQFLVALSAIDSLWEAPVLGLVDPDVRKAAYTVRESLWALSAGELDFQTAYEIARALQDQLADFQENQPDEFDIKLPVKLWARGGVGQPPEDGESKALTHPVQLESELVDPDSIQAERTSYAPPRAYKIETDDLLALYGAMEGRTGIRPKMPTDSSRWESEGYRWLPIRIHVPELSLPAVPPNHSKANKRWKGAEKGSIPTHMHRYAIDRYVFGKKAKANAGIAVLVDVSGSMNLTAADLVRILEEVPAATVARYNAKSGHGSVAGGGHGDLVILAQKGRRVADGLVGQGSGGYNACDLPALEWLARQPGVKYWLSDGGVTGENDNPSYSNSKQVWRFVIEHDIYQVFSVTELIEVLQQKRDLRPLDIIGLKRESAEWGANYYQQASDDPELLAYDNFFREEV